MINLCNAEKAATILLNFRESDGFFGVLTATDYFVGIQSPPFDEFAHFDGGYPFGKGAYG